MLPRPDGGFPPRAAERTFEFDDVNGWDLQHGRRVRWCALPTEDLGSDRTRKDVARAFADWCFERRNQLPPEPGELLTSGPERRLTTPFYAGGKERYEGRLRWWDDYRDESFCVFGRYWRLRLVGDTDGDHPFDDSRRYAALGRGRAMCIDYSVGKRWQERLAPRFDGRFQTRLAARRHPDNVLIFDDGENVRLLTCQASSMEEASPVFSCSSETGASPSAADQVLPFSREESPEAQKSGESPRPG